jgi:dolichol kinase
VSAASPRPGLLRPLLHAGTGLVALTLGVLPGPWALAGAVLGVVAGWVILPRTPLEAKLRRPGEPFLCGLRTYPLAVLALVVLLPPAEAAAAWGVLAFGDAAAALAGGLVASPSLFGHPKATCAGSGAYVLVGGAAAWALSAAVVALGGWSGQVEAGPAPAAAACFLAALAAAILDLVPLPPDDNAPAAAAAGCVLYFTRGLM